MTTADPLVLRRRGDAILPGFQLGALRARSIPRHASYAAANQSRCFALQWVHRKRSQSACASRAALASRLVHMGPLSVTIP